MTRALSAYQQGLVAQVGLAALTLVKLELFSDRAAGTVGETFWLALISMSAGKNAFKRASRLISSSKANAAPGVGEAISAWGAWLPRLNTAEVAMPILMPSLAITRTRAVLLPGKLAVSDSVRLVSS